MPLERSKLSKLSTSKDIVSFLKTNRSFGKILKKKQMYCYAIFAKTLLMIPKVHLE